MAMNRRFLDLLVCPTSGSRLNVVVQDVDGDDVRRATLSADTGNVDVTYRLTDGIASFVDAEQAASQTARSFAQKWKRHADYRRDTDEFYIQWFLQRYGFADAGELAALLNNAEYVLDAGTGAGRDAAHFARLCNATVFAVDITADALRNARKTIEQRNVAFVQANVNLLPFPDGFFDFINCDQVIHHTPNPPAAFRRLAAKLKPGGQVCTYVYRKKAAVREFVDDHVRRQIMHGSFDDALGACEGLTKLGRALASLKCEIEIAEDIPVLGIRRGRYDLQRFVHWNLFKCFWNDDFDFFTNNIINADWYHPENCFRYDPDEFRDWFADGWDVQAWDVQEAGISCRARKR